MTAAKAYVALIALVAQALTEVAPESWQPWLRIVVAVGGAFAVWAVPNKEPNDGGSL